MTWSECLLVFTAGIVGKRVHGDELRFDTYVDRVEVRSVHELRIGIE